MHQKSLACQTSTFYLDIYFTSRGLFCVKKSKSKHFYGKDGSQKRSKKELKFDWLFAFIYRRYLSPI